MSSRRAWRVPRLVRALLHLYPPAFRARFGHEIDQVIRASRHDGPNAGAFRFWVDVTADIVIGAARERIESFNEWRRTRKRLALARTHGFTLEPSTQGDAMGTLAQDIRYAWRTIRKSPGVALVVIVSLALGIGANTLIYSVVDGIILRPFPYPNADRLVSIGVTFPAMEGERRFIEAISPPEYNDLRNQCKSCEYVTAVSRGTASLSGRERSVRVFVLGSGSSGNALLIEATPSDYERPMRVIGELDVMPNQVVIEATIAEVTLNDELKMGVRWFFANNKKQDFSFTDAANGTREIASARSKVRGVMARRSYQSLVKAR